MKRTPTEPHDTQDSRAQWTVKAGGPELRELVRRAAKAGGQTQVAFIVAALTAAAQARLKGEDGGAVPVVVPSRLEARLEAQEAAQATLAATLAAMRNQAQAAQEAARARQERVEAALDELRDRAGQEARRGVLAWVMGKTK